jgi:ApbE superfamily uncharacterized protein (UPF0280 family)
MQAKSLFKETFEFKETRGLILSDSRQAIAKAISSLRENREKLERYARKNPKFLYSLTPIKVDDDTPLVAKIMAEAAAKVEVGPMAAVAGALADLAVKEMVSAGAKVAVVENGGEISAVSELPIDVALLAGDTPLSRKVGFRLEKFPVGVATSSATFGYAFSLGEADSVTIFSKDACLADAAATAVCNAVKGEDCDSAVKHGIEVAMSIGDVKGVLIIFRGKVAVAGEIPKLINITGEERV